jgi:hypothetical protein
MAMSSAGDRLTRMTRFAIDAGIALRLVAEGIAPAAPHTLVGPSVLRTDALENLYGDLRAGRIEDAEGRRLLDGIAMLKIRLLGDRVSRATAWRIAVRLDAPDVRASEYLAVATLQADVLVTDDPALRAAAERIDLPLGAFDDLRH